MYVQTKTLPRPVSLEDSDHYHIIGKQENKQKGKTMQGTGSNRKENTTQIVALSLYSSPSISGNNLPRNLNYKLHSFPLVAKQ